MPDALWGGASAEGLSDHPTAPGRNGGSRRAPIGTGDPDAARQIPRSRLPLPPVPVGPRTSAAPFRAVPTPELPGGPAGDGRLSVPAAQRERAIRLPDNSAVPLPPRPARVWADDEPELVSTGPGLSASGARASGPAPRLPRQTTPAGVPSPAYGDWTKPSHPSEPLNLDLSADAAGQLGLPMPPAPPTTAIPERPLNRRMSSSEPDDMLDSAEFDAPFSEERPLRGPQNGPATGPVGGRAAMRAERQAVDMARRKAAKKRGAPVGVPDEENGSRRRPSRVLMGLVAMTVVALGVLGVYSVVSPDTTEASSETPAAQTTAPSVLSEAPVLPPLATGAVSTAAAPATPVKAPVTVLNATEINGLAADVAGIIGAGGWETPGVGGYLAGDIAATTVFFTEGDETQRQAAIALVEAFPQLEGPAPRFFELPADVTAPGLVVVLAGPWQP